MEKRKQWQKPELSVLARSKSKKTVGPSRSGPVHHYSEPGPSAHYGGLMRNGGTQYYLGPAPAPAPAYVGPAPEAFYIGPLKTGRK